MSIPKDPIKAEEWRRKQRESWTPERKKEAKNRMNKRFEDPKEREKISKIQKKRFENPEEIKRLSESRKGEKNPMYGRKGELCPAFWRRGENHQHYGKRCYTWKGGRTKTKQGYILIYLPESHLANKQGYVYEHRLVAEQHLGRLLSEIEVVHHINGIRDDNRPENLYLFENRRKHTGFHNFPYFIISNII